MDVYTAVFNLHVNNAGKRANRDVIQRFGRVQFQQIFPKLYRNGIMTVFHTPPTPITEYWANQVVQYVNKQVSP